MHGLYGDRLVQVLEGAVAQRRRLLGRRYRHGNGTGGDLHLDVTVVDGQRVHAAERVARVGAVRREQTGPDLTCKEKGDF